MNEPILEGAGGAQSDRLGPARPSGRAEGGRTSALPSDEGPATRPLYAKAEAAPALLLAERSSCRVVGRIDLPDPGDANRAALEEAGNGANGLVLAFAGAPTARGFGLRTEGVEGLERVLDGIRLDAIALRLETAPFAAHPVHEALARLVERQDLDPARLDVDVGLDPIGDMARLGFAAAPWPETARRLAAAASALRGLGFAGPLLRADGRPHHEAGASEAQELAAVTATGVAYLRALEAAGLTLDAARHAVAFVLAADADLTLSLPKIRALRHLWARVETACGLAPEPIRLHVETAWRCLARRDPWTNILRGTLGCVAAVLGGADSVSVLPFTSALGLPDAFARRLARNTPLVALEEAHLGRVRDPAAGSGAFESLTGALCGAAWTGFQGLERDGGMAAALITGRWQARVAAVRARRADAVARRGSVIVGTSDFADPDEAAPAVLMPAPPVTAADSPFSGEPRQSRAATPGDVAVLSGTEKVPGASSPWEGGAPDPVRFDPLPSVRASEPFERLRERADRERADAVRRAGDEPAVFLATLGAPSAFAARAAFARRCFAAGGFGTVGDRAFASTPDLVDAFRGSAARAACLCASGSGYDGPVSGGSPGTATQAESTARALVAAGAMSVLLAGPPGSRELALRAAGVDDFVFDGSDLVLSLARLQRRMGMMP